MSNPLKDLGLSLEDLQAIPIVRGIKDYEMSRDIKYHFSIKKSKKVKKNKKKIKNLKQVFLKQE